MMETCERCEYEALPTATALWWTQHRTVCPEAWVPSQLLNHKQTTEPQLNLYIDHDISSHDNHQLMGTLKQFL